MEKLKTQKESDCENLFSVEKNLIFFIDENPKKYYNYTTS